MFDLLTVRDAMGRQPSGYLLGNYQWWGSYQECTGISVKLEQKNRTLNGQYCSAIITNVIITKMHI